MHSFYAPLGTTFNYNGDLSGLITVTSVNPNTQPIDIPWEDIAAFYLEQRRRKIIAQLENMSYEELEEL